MKSVVRFSLTLLFICVIASGLLAFVNKLTKPKIKAQAKQEQELALKDVMPGALSFEVIEKNSQINYYKALDKDKKIIGYCFLAKKYGYSSDIVTMVGLTKDGSITGIKILEQSETPGLGAKIIEVKQTKTIWDIFKKDTRPKEKINPWFQEQFKGKNVNDFPPEAGSPSAKKVDAITGATISSKAVIDSIQEKAKEISRIARDESAKTPGALADSGEIKNAR